MDYIFKCFKTPGACYVYDRHTNSVFSVQEQEYTEFCEIEKGKVNPEKSEIFLKYHRQGLLQKNVVEKIEHPATDFLDYLSNNRMEQLILQVTQQCNLRCAYCVYSGLYDNRTHSNKEMTFETAKKAIDFFLARTREMNHVNISFYGGEPLLEFDLIKKCVAYVNSIVEGKEVRFGTTTNGTLLKDEVVDFLYNNDFHFSISLDGSKKEHDASRKFPSGAGSFDLVMKNVKRIKERYPEYAANNISFMTTINPNMNLDCVMEFFSTDEVMSDSHIIFNTMADNGLKGELKFEEGFRLRRKYEYLKLLLMYVGKLNEEAISPMVITSKEQSARTLRELRKHRPLLSTMHHNGPCLPGIKRLFVTADGKCYPCERVSENHDYFCIGSIDEGLQISKMEKLINNGKVIAEKCKNCWNLRQCLLCSSLLEIDDEINEIDKNSYKEQCRKQKHITMSSLYELCALKEFGCDLTEGGV
ncbi:Cys-rich peptide radical SAM maturase CcpM [Anaerolentibacter hominis]|uniref:Cys-rich peptide radical SAM maturase CcpM n=1 Tax=Anaerolentibacter hominis TaxID=3079009 RepID=UPI0031B7EE65